MPPASPTRSRIFPPAAERHWNFWKARNCRESKRCRIRSRPDDRSAGDLVCSRGALFCRGHRAQLFWRQRATLTRLKEFKGPAVRVASKILLQSVLKYLSLRWDLRKQSHARMKLQVIGIRKNVPD